MPKNTSTILIQAAGSSMHHFRNSGRPTAFKNDNWTFIWELRVHFCHMRMKIMGRGVRI